MNCHNCGCWIPVALAATSVFCTGACQRAYEKRGGPEITATRKDRVSRARYDEGRQE